jgi:hypothetical protein
MRINIESSFVSLFPHMFHPSILSAYGIAIDGEVSQIGNVVGYRKLYKEENFFDCEEGWLPIIQTFAQCLDRVLSENETVNSDEETDIAKSTVYITGALSHYYRLCIVVEMSGTIDANTRGKINALQEFAEAMSGCICEICSTPVRLDVSGPVRCAVCNSRETD